jgi:hypothetical protein
MRPELLVLFLFVEVVPPFVAASGRACGLSLRGVVELENSSPVEFVLA